MSELHPMHPARMWNDAKDCPREALYAVVMLAPLQGIFTYAMIRQEQALQTGLELAGGPEPFAESLALGSVIYVMIYVGFGQYLFAGDKERESE